MRLFGLVCVIAASGLGASSAQTVDLRPGRYAVTVEVEMPGMKMPPEKDVQCVTREDLKNLSRLAFDEELEKTCKVFDYKATGSKMTFTATCGDSGEPLKMNVDMTLAPESFVGVMKATQQGRPVMTSRVSGKRIGDCAKRP